MTLYEAAGGGKAMLALAHAWHARCLSDEVVAHAFSHGYRDDHSERLAAYWAEALGGPAEYSRALGDETTVVRMHSGNGEHDEMDARALACFVLALDDARIPPEPRLRRALIAYFEHGLGRMARYPHDKATVPAGLRLQRWSWDGPVE